MPPAARLSDMHTCPMVTPGTPPIPHVGGPIIPANSPNVIIGSLPAARVSDQCVCVGPMDVIVKGSATVLINSLPAARIGDNTAHGGVIVTGWPTVIRGDAGGGGAPSSSGAPPVASPAAPSSSSSSSATPGSKSPASPGPGTAEKGVATGLGSDVDKVINESPTLSAKLENLQKAGWKIQTKNSGGTFADRPSKTIFVDVKANNTAASKVQALSHEAGHAAYTPDPGVPIGKLSKKDYVAANVKGNLKDEGEATLSNIETRNEILKAGGPDIGIAGDQRNAAAYEKAYADYQKSGNRDQARDSIGQIYADHEHTSNSGETYRQYYSKSYEKFYDAQKGKK